MNSGVSLNKNYAACCLLPAANQCAKALSHFFHQQKKLLKISTEHSGRVL